MGGDDAVDFGHEADGFVKGHDDAVVMDEIVGAERPSSAVLEPLLADLVAADMEVPYLLRHAAKTDRAGEIGVGRALLRFDGVNPDGVVGPAHLLNHGFRRAGEGDADKSSSFVNVFGQKNFSRRED